MKLREEDKEEEWFALTEKIVANSLCIMLSEVESWKEVGYMYHFKGE